MERSREQHNLATAFRTLVVRNKLEDMQKQIQAQRGIGITLAAADLLLADVEYVLNNLEGAHARASCSGSHGR